MGDARRAGPGSTTRRARVVLAIGVLVGAVVAGPHLGPAEAACLPPQLSVDTPTARPGDTIVVSGIAFGDGCNDQFTGPGPYPDPLGSPLAGVEIEFHQGGRVVPLGVVDAGADYTLSVPVTVPSDATAGPSEVMAVRTGPKTAIPASLTIVTPAPAVSGAAPDAGGDTPVGAVGGSGAGADATATGPPNGPLAARPAFTG